MHIYALITIVSSYIAYITCADFLTSSKFDVKVHSMALDMSDKSRIQSTFSMRPSIMLTQMVIIYAIYSRLLFEILSCSGLGM